MHISQSRRDFLATLSAAGAATDVGARRSLADEATPVSTRRRTYLRWVTTDEVADPMELFVQGKIDAFLAFVPQPQQLRDRKIGRVLVDMAMDEPGPRTSAARGRQCGIRREHRPRRSACCAPS